MAFDWDMMSHVICQPRELFFTWRREDQVSPETLDEAGLKILGMVQKVKEDALISPSDLGALFGFSLLRGEGEVGDRVVNALFEERQ